MDGRTTKWVEIEDFTKEYVFKRGCGSARFERNMFDKSQMGDGSRLVERESFTKWIYLWEETVKKKQQIKRLHDKET